ncbi:MAG: hypothetical protein KUG52_06015, partial [Immundisolibacteraceae bacterium]|nr:hypothetical protein [Immundisolibacteraceae bacterium]
MIRRFLALLQARNMEFLRDKSSLGWNVAFPILLVFGLAAIFSGDPRPMFKVSVLTTPAELAKRTVSEHRFLQNPFIQFTEVTNKQQAIDTVRLHKSDLLFDPSSNHYWINLASEKGHHLEAILLAATSTPPQRLEVSGEPVRL